MPPPLPGASLPPHAAYCSQQSLFVADFVNICLSVNTITPEPLEMSSQHFQKSGSYGQTGSQVRKRLCAGVSDVLGSIVLVRVSGSLTVKSVCVCLSMCIVTQQVCSCYTCRLTLLRITPCTHVHVVTFCSSVYPHRRYICCLIRRTIYRLQFNKGLGEYALI